MNDELKDKMMKIEKQLIVIINKHYEQQMTIIAVMTIKGEKKNKKNCDDEQKQL